MALQLGKKLLEDAIGTLINTKQDKVRIISGFLGTFADGKEIVIVPNRPNFVYVRLTGDNETVQAFNERVSPIFDLKVLVEVPHEGMDYYQIFGRDTQQYENWDGKSFLPRHGGEHSFGDGNDPTFIWQRQIIEPLGGTPQPTGNIMQIYIQQGLYEWSGQRKYWGGGWSPSYISVLPTGSFGQYFTLYLDGDDGLLKNVTGTSFAMLPFAPTGTVDLMPTIDINDGIPLLSVLITSGTTRISWDAVFDLRHFINAGKPVLSTNISGFSDGSVIFVSGSSLHENNAKFNWNNTYEALLLGSNILPENLTYQKLNLLNNGSVTMNIISFGGAGVSSTITLYSASGTISSPHQTLLNRQVGNIAFGGYNPTIDIFGVWIAGANITATATEDWDSTNKNGMRMDFFVRGNSTYPSASRNVLRLDQDGFAYRNVTGSNQRYLFEESTDTLGGFVSNRTLKIDANMELDPTGAIINDVLTYNGIKWIAQTPASGNGTVFGSGTADYLARWININTLGKGLIQDNNSHIGLNSGPSSNVFLTITQPTETGSQSSIVRFTGGSHVQVLAGAEIQDVQFSLNRTITWNSGSFATQRSFIIAPPTLAFNAPSIITTAATMAITNAPTAGANATITKRLALWVQAGDVLFAAAHTVSGGLNVGAATGAGANQIITKGGSEGLRIQDDGAYVSFYSTAGSRQGYLQIDSGVMRLINETNNGIAFYTNSVLRMTIAATGHITPNGTGTQNFGDASNYWADISYKTLTDRGCLGCFDSGVEMPDGRMVSDIDALCLIQKHPTLKTIYGIPRLDYSTMPKAVYKPAFGKGEDGAETTALISIMIGAIKQLNQKIRELEHKNNVS